MPSHELIPRTGKWVYDRVNNLFRAAATATGPTHLDNPYSPEGKSEADAMLALRSLYESEPPHFVPQLPPVDLHRGPPAQKHPPILPQFLTPPEEEDMSKHTFVDRQISNIRNEYNQLMSTGGQYMAGSNGSVNGDPNCPPRDKYWKIDSCTGQLVPVTRRRRRKRLLSCSDKADLAFLVGTLGKGSIASTAISSLLAKCN